MKEVDDTPVTESRSEDDPFLIAWNELVDRIVELEHALALLLEQRVTARPPEGGDDPEWF